MKTVGVICEYNPFHNGHAEQLRRIRKTFGPDTGLVCLMSGSYTQRGEPAIFDKMIRAEAALRCGGDLVLELPLTRVLSSAEGFASGGVAILSALGCDALCFGCEAEDPEPLFRAAQAECTDPSFGERIRRHLSDGRSYPAARQAALEELGVTEALCRPNDILAVEYCKALLRQQSPMKPIAIHRPGSYHAEEIDSAAPSATSVRRSLTQNSAAQRGEPGRAEDASWRAAVPPALYDLYEGARLHTLAAGERALLARLRTLPDEAFAALPFGSEGLWSKLMKNCRSCASVEEILIATKSKRYPRTRLQRMLLCAYLGLTKTDLETPPPYVRVLGFNDRGRAALHQRNDTIPLVNAGADPANPGYYALEQRAADLYGLCSVGSVPPGGAESRCRVVYLPEEGNRSPAR